MEVTPREIAMDCCESPTSPDTTRRSLLLGGASFAAWAYLPKFARHFVADDPPPALVARLREVFSRSDAISRRWRRRYWIPTRHGPRH